MTIVAEKITDTSTPSPFVLTLLTTPGSAALRIKNSDLPYLIQVDETANQELARFLGAGVQVYDFIQRVLTFGGQAPASCVPETVASVPYTALYIFWGPR